MSKAGEVVTTENENGSRAVGYVAIYAGGYGGL